MCIYQIFFVPLRSKGVLCHLYALASLKKCSLKTIRELRGLEDRGGIAVAQGRCQASFMRQAHSDEGEMLEWLKRHAWKACKLQKGFGGSNPPLSAKIF